MPRKINMFNGRCLIVGGGWEPPSFNPPWRTEKDFYTIDNGNDQKPDDDLDINTRNIPSEYEDRFDFIYFEHFPDYAVSDQTFKNALSMLSSNGMMLFVGGIKDKKNLEERLEGIGFFNVDIKEIEAVQDEKIPFTIFSAAKNEDGYTLEYLKNFCLPCFKFLEHYNFFNDISYDLNKEDDDYDQDSDTESSEEDNGRKTNNQVSKSTLFSNPHENTQTQTNKKRQVACDEDSSRELKKKRS